MRNAKFFMLLLLAIVCTLCTLPSFANTATFNGITWTYTVSSGKASLGGGSSSSRAVSTLTSGAITIPSTLGGYPVTSIGQYAFSDCSSLTSVTIPDSVTSIGWRAFQGCSGLTSVTIPDSVTSIGGSAFSGCRGLKSVTIGNGVTSIGYEAFSGCWILTSITIPDSVTTIGDYAFDSCSGLTSVTIGNGVTSIGYRAFHYCSGLTSVTIPDGVTSIGESAFDGCNLRTVTVPQCVCASSMSTVFWPEQLITNVVIANSVTSIGSSAFAGCSGLTSVTIPDSVTSIGSSAFTGCSGLTSVTIGNGVTSIGDQAFYYCSGLTSVTIPDGVTSIGSQAFQGCSGLTSVTIGNGASIGDRAFWRCSGLTSVYLDGNAPEMGNNVFFSVGNCTAYVYKNSTGWGVSIPGRWMGVNISYRKDNNNVGSSTGGFDGGSLEPGVIVENHSYAKAQSVPGVLCGADGALVGTVRVSVGKKNKNNQVKVSASVTTMNGKAVKSNAVTVKLPVGSEVARGTLVFKSPIGSMDFTIDAAGNITLEGGRGVLASAKVGGNLPNGKMAFDVDIDTLPAVDAGFAILDDLLPDGVEVTVTGGRKLNAGKAAMLKYAKDKASGTFSLVGLDDPKKPNVLGLKLTYTPKTGVFKGSFNVYATNEDSVPAGKAPKLKKYRVNVMGFMVDDGNGPKGVGEATIKKPAVKWSVTIK